MMILPPSPPSPPSGPPCGTYFSRRKLTQPFPPRPPWTSICTRSTNIIGATCATRPLLEAGPLDLLERPGRRKRPGRKVSRTKKRTLPQSESVPAKLSPQIASLIRCRQHVYPPAFLVELDRAVDQGEQRVILAAAD